MTVLDTSFLIHLERGDTKAESLLRELEARSDPVRVPAAAWVEFLSTFPPGPRGEAVRRLEGSVSFEPFSRETADEAARLQFELLREGRGLGWHDLQVAATALYLRETLVSSDRAFRDLPGLDLRAF